MFESIVPNYESLGAARFTTLVQEEKERTYAGLCLIDYKSLGTFHLAKLFREQKERTLAKLYLTESDPIVGTSAIIDIHAHLQKEHKNLLVDLKNQIEMKYDNLLRHMVEFDLVEIYRESHLLGTYQVAMRCFCRALRRLSEYFSYISTEVNILEVALKDPQSYGDFEKHLFRFYLNCILKEM